MLEQTIDCIIDSADGTRPVHVVRPDVGLCPVAFASGAVVATRDHKSPDTVDSIARNVAVSEGEREIHPMPPRADAVIVKTGPRSRGEIDFRHIVQASSRISSLPSERIAATDAFPTSMQ